MRGPVNESRAVVELNDLLSKSSAHVFDVSTEHGITVVKLDPTDAYVLAELAKKGLK